MNRKDRRAEKSRTGSERNSSQAVPDLLAKALEHHNAGRLPEAENTYRQALEIDPQNPDTLHLLGVLANDVGKHDAAIELIRRAVAIREDIPFFRNNLGNALKDAGKTDEAVSQYRQALALKPDYAEALSNLGNVYKEQEKLEEAQALYERSLLLKPNVPETHNNLGTVLKLLDRTEDAKSCYSKALELKPDYPEALYNLAKTLADQDRFPEAVEYFIKVITLKPSFVEAYISVAQCLFHQHMMDAAVACYKQALAIKPDSSEAMNNMGAVLLAQGKREEALDCFRRGQIKSNILLAMVYAASVHPGELAEAARNWSEQVADLHMRHQSFVRDNNPDRKLRIGYVSPDFRTHPVNFFFEPLLKLHRDKFELYAYSNVKKEDAVTARLKSEFHYWRNIKLLSDDQAVDLIEQDKIDILVDLAGHTGDNRLLIFARKPAPVQVTWLGFPATTGMKAMDYRITDVYAEPEGMTEHLNVEKLWRLPTVFACYQAPDRDIPVIDHPPFEDNGYITFGCFNNFAKVTDPVLEIWAKIMAQVPNSRLMLEIAGLDSPEFRAETEARLKNLGLPMERLILITRRVQNQFVLYNKIDIALDPFPCNGGTTSFDCMWMGVPLIALAGEHFVSRMGVTILTNAGMPELIARDKDEYVKIATELARDKDRLRQLRHGLRDRVVKSPLMDQQTFAKNMERAYREMWKRWCDEQS